jgi:hypothetical protein
MKFFSNVITLFLVIVATTFSPVKGERHTYKLVEDGYITPQNNCINFSVGPGTGCSWMCSYCANTLGTNNYYFTSGVCTYQTGGCVGNPQTGVTYTCCSA